MRSVPAALLGFLALWPALAQPSPYRIPARVAEEAEILQQNAVKIVSQETLEQRSVMPPSRFRPRLGSAMERASGPRFRVREVVSEFSFGALRGAQTHDLVEFRQVLSVDDRPLQTTGSALRALSQGIQAGDERTRKRMLEEFARNGLVDIATDYALILLTFTSRGQRQIEFTPLGQGYVGTDAAVTVLWKQKSTDGGVLEFHGQQSVRRALQGTLWVRASDGLPLRVRAWMEYTDPAKHGIRDEATVDYTMSQHGFLTPASVLHRHLVNGKVMTENLYSYQPFKLFSTDSSVKFGDLPDTAPPPAPIKK
jgi:hypothetical protein